MDGELESIVSCYNIGWGGDQIMEGKEFPQKKKRSWKRIFYIFVQANVTENIVFSGQMT
jgi:hypothetical protein